MIVKQNKIPELSILKKDEKIFHYIDSFQSQYLTIRVDCDVVHIGKLFLSSGPKWADRLMSIRDRAVGLFGLKTTAQLSAEERNPDHFKFEPGEQLDIFKLFTKTENELILGEDDKHLSFRVSLLLDCKNEGVEKKKINITTTVKYKNLFGWIYFLPVRPIHQFIVKETLREMIRKIEDETNDNR